MKKLALLFTLVPALIFSQITENCIPEILYQVTSPSGTILRTGPDQRNKVVTYLSSNEYVLVCETLFAHATFDNKQGHWRRVRYKNQFGYLFDGFLTKTASHLILNDSSWTVSRINNSSKTNSVEIGKVKATPAAYVFAVESYNYCGDISQLDPGIHWYGIYYNHDLELYQMTKVELEVIRSKYALGAGLEFDVRSKSKVAPHFLIGSESSLDTNLKVDFNPSFFEIHPQTLFPGQSINIYSSKPVHDVYEFTMFATGNVTDVGLCPVMKNYKMKLTGEMNDNLIVQDLTIDIPYFGTCGMPSLYWFGDFNADLYPDFILASKGKDQTTFVLFVSDNRANGKLVRKAGEWSYKKCD
jgi:hypothetical protein